MTEKVIIWEPTEWKCLCPYCNAKNLSKIPALKQRVYRLRERIYGKSSPHRRRLTRRNESSD